MKIRDGSTTYLVEAGFKHDSDFPRKRNVDLWCPQNKQSPVDQENHSICWY